jgi:hypothetical protein
LFELFRRISHRPGKWNEHEIEFRRREATMTKSIESGKSARPIEITEMIARLLAVMSFVIMIAPLSAQTGGDDSRRLYDISREVTVSGRVTAVLTKPAPGMTWGGHLLIATVSGTVDASLGRWGLRGNEAPSVINGECVEVRGVMNIFNGKQVVLARTVKVGGKVYVIHDAHGIPISPQARERATRKGESL